MTNAKSSLCLLGALVCPFGTALGQDSFLELEFRDEKAFQITGPSQFDYLGGQWVVVVLDGDLPILPCFANFGEAYQVPVQLPPCPAGTTSLITQGDFDGDGIREDGLYVSTDQPIPARSIEPFYPELVELDAAPASLLPRPVAAFNWTDLSIRAFYDIIQDPINGVGYELAAYSSVREYLPADLVRHRNEIVPGTYRFKFLARNTTPEAPGNFFISIAHREMVEAAPGPGGQSVETGGIFVGNDFRIVDGQWNNGALEIDPRLRFDVNWEGFNPSTFFGNDQLSFSIRDRNTGLIQYPPIPFPEDNPETRQLIGSADLGIPSGIDIGAGFLDPGVELVAELEFRRALVTGSTVDRSGRFFLWDINLIDSYEGFLTVNYPDSVPLSERAGDFDFDDDGFTNLEEFGLQTDPLDPASVPNVTPTLAPITNQCLLDIPKRPAVGSSLTYFVQSSVDLETWTTITPDDPNWFIIFDNEDRITVLSRESAGVNPCFLRVRFQEN